jgi:hypothetical protein
MKLIHEKTRGKISGATVPFLKSFEEEGCGEVLEEGCSKEESQPGLWLSSSVQVFG